MKLIKKKTKLCPKCGELKPLSKWSNNIKRSDGLQSYCKICMYQKQIEWRFNNKEKCCNYTRVWGIDNPDKLKVSQRKGYLKKYGLTFESFDAMFEKQNYKCAICGIDDFNIGRGGNIPYIDHCHETGEVRGLLCHHCNSALGGFKDSVDYLKAAIKYLEKSEIKDGN